MLDPDHNLLFTPYVAAEDADTLDDIFHGTQDEIARKCMDTPGSS